MSLYYKDPHRRLIPRWRTWDLARTGDVMRRVPKEATGQKFGPGNPFFDEKLASFESEPSVSTATELVVASIVCGAVSAGQEAADFLRKNSALVPNSVESLVNWSTETSSQTNTLDHGAVNFLSSTDALRREIRRLRQSTHESPRNPFLWVNLGRAYLLVGENHKAKHCLRVATTLAPENRYVLRCTARYLIHINQAIDAVRLLQRTSSTKHDPWLMAVEIAAAEIAETGSKTAQIAKRILKAPDDPANLTELAGSFATLQLYAGNTKGATKNFRFSLIQPTENAVAQAEWASTQIPGIRPNDSQLSILRGFEARAATAYKAGKMDRALDCLARWGLDEPYSTRPFVTGSYLACIATHDFDQAIRFCEFGLQANGDDPTLLNNYAVALAMSDQVDKAKSAFASALATKSDELPEHIRLATKGLLLFRGGEPERGRASYLASLGKAPDSYKLLIALHLAQEELNANSDHQKQAWALVHSHARPKDRPEIVQFVKNLGHDPTDWK